MKNILDNIEKQFEFNLNKNLLFGEKTDHLKFSPETLYAIEEIDSIDGSSERQLIDYLTNRTYQIFCSLNQYYTFDKTALDSLKNIYAKLFINLRKREFQIDLLAQKHYLELRNWLITSNSFAVKMYLSKGTIIKTVPCSEYDPEFQLNIMQLDIDQIKEPLLDIGCGEKGNLVTYLKQHNIEAFGFDRFASESLFLFKSDWFEFNFDNDKWGTIISHLGFSNHFRHHHSRIDGNYISYTKKYLEILNSLKKGGSFHYSPDLPFIEQYLDVHKYHITKYNIGNYDFKSTEIVKL